ncbi:hypothetical protein ACFQI7_19170 [Paenibacillus allorhizosphaerae]|uniref:Uncharacterized protein n=1 Tax=Paenibacillus allorhizosphaerae TaxID=2849866 RepID=A0ABM8VNS1_9BACL|nr:hypothetical protein [Paenibacillus allorhizosphaerae]CAG7651922.1 hypothetical protein PAECIP111802_05092 [Paenibacillus allorhizosphaerae]
MTTIVDSLDVRKGGVWWYVQRDPAGNEYAHNGLFHETARRSGLSIRTNSKAARLSGW